MGRHGQAQLTRQRRGATHVVWVVMRQQDALDTPAAPPVAPDGAAKLGQLAVVPGARIDDHRCTPTDEVAVGVARRREGRCSERDGQRR